MLALVVLSLAGCADQLASTEEASTYDQDVNYWFEAEAGALTAPIAVQNDPSASRGAGITSTGGGAATFALDAQLGGTFVAWARVLAPSGGSLYVQLDAGTAAPLVVGATPAWTWIEVPNASFAVASGSHALRVVSPSAGVRIDRVLLTNNPAFVPVAQTIQAETASLVAPMQVGSTGALFNRTSYLYVPNFTGQSGGYATIELAAPAAGTYTFWGRTSAETIDDDRFEVDFGGSQSFSWQLPITGASAWAWSRIPDAQAYLSPRGMIRILRSDDGAKLDRLIMTNDPGFVPVEPAPVVNSL